MILISAIVILSLGACSSAGDDGDNTVEVSMGLSSAAGQKMVTATGSLDPSDFRFFIQALPAWTSTDYASIKGTIQNYTKINTYTPGMSLGYFAQGQWTFNVEVRDTDETTVLYRGSISSYINTSNSSIIVPVSSVISGDGTISINISAPTVADGNANDDTLEITYGNNTVVQAVITRNMTTNMTEAVLAATSFPAGDYLFTIKHKNGAADIGGAIVALTVFPDVATAITGTVESGRWVSEKLTLTGITTATMTVTAEGGAVTVRKDTDIVFTANVDIDGAKINGFHWYVNGVRPDSDTGSDTFTFRKSKADYYQIFCVAQADDGNGTLVGCEAYITVTN